MPKSTTLDDLEGSLCTVSKHVRHCVIIYMYLFLVSHSVCF